MSTQKNLYNQPLLACSTSPITGYFRDGYCTYSETDQGRHNVCAKLTDRFLDFTASRGNNLRSIGLKHGDYWCICIARWLQAYHADPSIAPMIDFSRTNRLVGEYVDRHILLKYRL